MRLERARLQFFIVLTLSALTICLQWLVFQRFLARNCTATRQAHALLLHEIQNLGISASSSVDIIPLSPRHAVIRRLSSSLLSNTNCLPTLSRRGRRSLEFSLHANTHTDGVLLYIFSIIGARNRIAVELHSNDNAKICTMFAVHQGWRVVTLVESWAGYDAAQRWYEQKATHALSRWSEAGVQVLDAGRVVSTGLTATTRTVGIGGVVDLVVLFAQGGDDIAIMSSLNASLKPRVLMIRYEDYWGSHVKAVRTSLRRGTLGERLESAQGIGHDYSGASVTSLSEVAERVGYRLVWCLANEPIAILVDCKAGVGDRLETVDPASCIKMRSTGTKWRRDMEAMWDEAQEYDWDTYS